MTREEAIAIIENEKECVNRANKNDYCNRDCYNCELVKTDTEILTALDMAIKALEQESCEDAISRQAVLDLCERFSGSVPYSVLSNYDMLPLVNPQPKTGHWIFDQHNWHCSECGESPKTMGYVGSAEFMAEHFKYCNHCGAKMVEPQKSEDI